MMGLQGFRLLYEELKFIPREKDELKEKCGGDPFLIETLVTALKALDLADEIMISQADTIIQSTTEVTKCLKEYRELNACKQESSLYCKSDASSSQMNCEKNLYNDEANICCEISSNEVFETKFVKGDVCNNEESESKLNSEANTENECISDDNNEPKSYSMVAKSENVVVSQDSTDNDGFQPVKPRHRRSSNLKTSTPVIGRKSTRNIGICARNDNFEAFISRLRPDLSIRAMKKYCDDTFDENCIVEKLQTKYSDYSSFRITFRRWKKKQVLDPNKWETGVLVRPFY